MSYLLLYSGHDGQTKKIITEIALHLRKAGAECDVRSLQDNQSLNLAPYEKVLVGASIRYGHFNRALDKFAKLHAGQLNQMKTAFFGVNLTARKPDKRTPETNVYVRKFLAATPWKPTVCTVFAGALLYPRYGWFDRMMIRLIMKMTKGETDTSKEVEYTDWQQVEVFAAEFVQI
ncbi:menaquinone-dependent protoporphyrinogen IX dehydrogenase [Morganella morganii]|uniref:menaquinone-dependent protoporphyrinogen IX dehydrogenase n=1 Tax=Morganella morganii TaxID=582 RepID=UPI0015F42AF0|nr:menaquinone-dependent protoporphyrinogen IX dehydrogenase [Morganella morganii]MBA5809359.1 menaquinone-dependent protoporphyrinogen IX dehydrogenase [Morganella morganii]